MILGIEVGLILYGLYALVTGKFSLGKDRVLRGTPARLLILIGFLPIPFAFAICVGGSSANGAAGRQAVARLQWIFGGIELVVVVGCCVLLFAVGNVLYRAKA